MATLTLQGSAQIVSEFFEYSIANILYLRNVYPQEDFTSTQKYGLSLLIPTNKSLKKYISSVTSQLETWIQSKKVSRLVLVISEKETRQVVERWQFEIILESHGARTSDKPQTQVAKEIANLLRQITASVSFLPIFDDVTFNILAYTDKNVEVPATWVDSDPRIIKNAQVVKLRGFSTGMHKVDSVVSYKMDDNLL